MHIWTTELGDCGNNKYAPMERASLPVLDVTRLLLACYLKNKQTNNNIKTYQTLLSPARALQRFCEGLAKVLLRPQRKKILLLCGPNLRVINHDDQHKSSTPHRLVVT